MARLNGMILALLLSAAVPAAVLAQPKPEEAKKHAPVAKPAPHPAAAARPAPHPAPAAHPAPAPHPVVRAAPHAAPHPAVRAAPRPAPHPAARATPHVAPRQAARPEPRHAPSNARIIRREERRVQRQERHAPKVTEAPKAAPQKAAPAQAAAPQKAAPSVAAAPKAAAPAPKMTRAERRQERALRRQEDRSVRKLPASQRAARREEIRHAREQRAQKRQQTATPTVQAQPNAQLQRNAQQTTQRQARRNGRQRVAAQDARRGRFAAAFAQQPAATTTVQRQARHDRWSAREAWRHRARAPFIAWYGPVFWPYAYTDVFDYTFWPDGYDDGYWAYAYDDFVDGLFWGEEGPPAEYAYAPEVTGSTSASPAPVRYASVQQLCKQPGSGVTAWPIAEIEKKVGLTAEQKDLLAGMRRDAAKAADVFKASCPAENAFPLTPPGRLAAMTGRLQATLEAVDTVKPALDKFYNSLSDEQKERFNEIGPKPKAETTAKASADTAQSCKQPKPGLANLPIEKIEDAVKPTDAQADDLDKLQDATDKAVGILQAACPDQTPLTPPGRLDAMQTRLKAMIEAANTVKPALDSFYASLSNEQKAQFNRMGRELATAND